MASQLAAVGAPLAVSAILLVGDWRLVFYCVAAATAVATLGLVWATRRTALPSAGTADRSILAAGRAQWPIILTGIGFLGAAGFLWNGVFNLYGDYLAVAKGIDPATGRLLLSGMFAAGVPAFALTGRLADSVPNVPLLLGINSGFVVCIVALTLVEGIVAVAVVSLVLGYIIHSLFPAIDTYLLSSLPDRHRASAYAVFSASVMFVQAFGSGTVGLAVVRGVSYTRAFQLLALAVGLVVAVMFGLYRAGRLPAGGRPSETPAGAQSVD